MSEEFIEEINWDGKTVAVHPKSKLKKQMFPHKAALIIPKCDETRYILAKRAKTQLPFPNTWMCAIGGKVDPGESYLEAAHREAMEEANTSLDLVYVSSFKYDEADYKAIFNVYTTRKPVSISSFAADKREIQYFKAFSLRELTENIQADPDAFAPTFRTALVSFIATLENK